MGENILIAESHWVRALSAMAAVQFVMGLAFSVAPPILPLYLPHLGVHVPEDIRRWAGLMIGVTPLAAAITSPLWGRLLGKMDARVMVLISCISAALCTTAMSIAASPWQLLALRFSMGLFGGHIAACMSIASNAAPASRLGLALGSLTTAQLFGSLLGPLVGGGAADAFGDLRAPFLAGGSAALVVCPLLLLVPGTMGRSRGDSPSDTAVPESTTHKFVDLGIPLVVLFLVQAAIMGPQPMVSLQVSRLVGPSDHIATLAGFAFSVLGISGLFAAPSLGALGDRVGQRRVLIASLLLGACVTMLQAASRSYAGFVMLRFLAGICLSGVIPLVNASVARATQAGQRGRVLGMTAGAAFLGAFVGPLLSGLLAAALDVASVFIVSGVSLLLAAGASLAWRHRDHSRVDAP